MGLGFVNKNIAYSANTSTKNVYKKSASSSSKNRGSEQKRDLEVQNKKMQSYVETLESRLAKCEDELKSIKASPTTPPLQPPPLPPMPPQPPLPPPPPLPSKLSIPKKTKSPKPVQPSSPGVNPNPLNSHLDELKRRVSQRALEIGM